MNVVLRFLPALAAVLIAPVLPVQANPVSLVDINTLGRPDLGFARLGDDTALLQERYLIFSGSDESFSSVYGREPWVHDLQTGQTRLLADIHPGSADSSPSDFTALADVVVFTAVDPEHGRELWATDGSPAGTVRIADIRPGPTSGSIFELTAVLPNRLVFSVDDGVNGREPWTSDGTPAGTRLLADINPGAASSTPSGFVWLNGQLLFAANDGSSGLELWRWTVTQGAELVLDIRSGLLSSSPTGLRRVATSFGTFVLFSATTDSDGSQAWASDGTPSGTQQLFTIGSGASPRDFVWHSGLNRLFFSADDGLVGRELWQFHPSVGPSLVEDLRAGPDGSSPEHLAQVDDQLAFIAKGSDNLPRLHAYDGASIDPIVLLSNFSQEEFSPVVWSGQWFVNGQFNCHRWSPAGGHHTFTCQSSPDLAVLPDGVIHGLGSTANSEIWILDAAGQATQLTDFAGFSSSPAQFFWVGDEVFFSANDGISGFELWVSDGTPPGTRGFDLAPGSLDAEPRAFAEFSNRVWFVARDGEGERRLWFSNGTVAGTRLYGADLGGVRASFETRPLVFANALYAVLKDPDGWDRLARITAIDQPPIFLQFQGQFLQSYAEAASAQQLFVMAWTETTGSELFAISPDASRITALEIVPGAGDASPDEASLAVWQDQVFFRARDGASRMQLWRSDGQVPVQLTGFDGGQVSDEFIVPGPGGVYFMYRDAANECLLGHSDGHSVVLFSLSAPDECPEFDRDGDRVAATEDRLFFVMSTADEGTELWSSDGVHPPRLLDLRPGTDSSSPGELAAMGKRLLFTASDEPHGRELWMAEGDRATRLADIRPGPASSHPDRILIHPDGEKAVFAANDAQAWREPHWIDIERALRVFSDRFEPQ